jgi:hypothetical protein
MTYVLTCACINLCGRYPQLKISGTPSKPAPVVHHNSYNTRLTCLLYFFLLFDAHRYTQLKISGGPAKPAVKTAEPLQHAYVCAWFLRACRYTQLKISGTPSKPAVKAAEPLQQVVLDSTNGSSSNGAKYISSNGLDDGVKASANLVSPSLGTAKPRTITTADKAAAALYYKPAASAFMPPVHRPNR